jgi:hypothetical protein
MALGRSRNVHDIGTDDVQHFLQIRKAHSNPTALTQLLGHERFPIAKSDNFAVRNAVDGLHMLVGDLATADEGDAKHLLLRGQRSEDGSFIMLPSIAPTSWHFSVRIA